MTMFWIYDLQNWALCLLIVGFFVAVALTGLFASRPFAGRLLGSSSKHNDVVSFFFAGIGVLYGLALGLIAVATWENYTEIGGVIGNEAASVAALYRDLDGYPAPLRARLESLLREYTRFVIEKEWPAHKQGVALEDGDSLLDRFENEAMTFEPVKEREKIVQSGVLRSLDTVTEQRRLRLEAVPTGLPAALWSVVLIGAILNISLTYLFWVENLRLHAILVTIVAVFIGLLIFLTAAMDYPFRGEFSLSPDDFRTVLEKVMGQACR
jgi:hypothetical protein